MVSGPPASICIAPTIAARNTFPPAFAPRALNRQHDPRHPAQRGNVARPHQQIERQAVESKCHSGECRGEVVVRPPPRELIHPEAGEPQVQETKEAQRPHQRKREINQRRRIQRHGVPLRQERRAAIAERIPERQFALPETLLLKEGGRVGKKTIITNDKGLQSDQHLWKRGENEQREQNPKTQGREPVERAVFDWIAHYFSRASLFIK